MDHNRGNRVHTSCAKVSTVVSDTGKKEMIGFIVDETDTELRVHLCNNTWMMLPRGNICSDTGKYIFENSNTYYRRIIQVWPLRFIMYESGRADITMICYCYSNTNNDVCENFCS